MGFSNTSKHLVCMWMKIQELHGIKSLRDIQKTKPKLIAIEPKLIANPYRTQGNGVSATAHFQKWSEHGVFCTFWLENVLRATMACTFSTSQLPKVVRSWCVLYILTLTCASHHNGVHFFDISTAESGPDLVCFVRFDLETCFAPQRRAIFISHLASWLRTRRFSEPTFPPSRATNHWKNTVNRDSPTFSRILLFLFYSYLF